MKTFSGRTAVITGAGSGIGRALVDNAVGKGMTVLACDIDGASAEETVADLGNAATSMQVDVADQSSVDALADEAFRRLGQVDLLINNAGVFQGGLLWERSLDDWKWALEVNLWGIIHAARSFVPRMIAQNTEAHIVNTASVAAFVHGQYSSPYVVSKCAAFSVSECLAHDLRSEGTKVGVSVLCPSAITTGIARTDRVRPAELGTTSGEDAAFVADALDAMLQEGISPAEAAQATFQGVKAGDFLIATKPSYKEQLRVRYEALTERQLPETAPVD